MPVKKIVWFCKFCRTPYKTKPKAKKCQGRGKPKFEIQKGQLFYEAENPGLYIEILDSHVQLREVGVKVRELKHIPMHKVRYNDTVVYWGDNTISRKVKSGEYIEVTD